ncbi:hypothetical protein FA13DRAFT_807498 [Coprinellus micaceus]|uniref:Uncharacterized protein n=1 Tax=Coprinellus micaceus TaxID=71717 RepID=A0A4Y7S4Y5_COPMI|nr:hypothetical protein FA13DRAFT_807498 [Coprinellus micaceus]
MSRSQAPTAGRRRNHIVGRRLGRACLRKEIKRRGRGVSTHLRTTLGAGHPIARDWSRTTGRRSVVCCPKRRGRRPYLFSSVIRHHCMREAASRQGLWATSACGVARKYGETVKMRLPHGVHDRCIRTRDCSSRRASQCGVPSQKKRPTVLPLLIPNQAPPCWKHRVKKVCSTL